MYFAAILIHNQILLSQAQYVLCQHFQLLFQSSIMWNEMLLFLSVSLMRVCEFGMSKLENVWKPCQLIQILWQL